jgi:hypothetical protein
VWCGVVQDKLQDQSSDLYRGQVTCHVDATYVQVPLEDDDAAARSVVRLAYSPDPRVKGILEKYLAGGPRPDLERSHCRFRILLSFENKTQPMWVLNPRQFRKRACLLWPFEVKQALGIGGSVQDAWLEPLSLTPVGKQAFRTPL